jgi:small conductance mechanosensitive channel
MTLDNLYDKAIDWSLAHGPRALLGIATFAAGQWLLKLIRKWMSKSLYRKALDPTLRPFLVSLLITTLQVLLVLGVMQILGIQMTVFAALVGAVGVALGLALSGTLQNFTSGILILILKPYVVGDNIIAQGQTGTVASIQIFYTLVVTFDNQTVVIPNSKLSNEVIVNLSREGIRRLDIEMKQGFAFSFEDVKRIVERTIDRFPHAIKEKSSRVGILSIEPDGYKIAVQVWVNAHGFIDSKLHFQEKLIADLKAAGIKLPGM